tara:strand:- start:895 stop:2526 length:1632 start_codon:yes stop_codon:yes gene_type:complete
MPDPITGLCPQGGCTDPTACNYNSAAGWDDGSCTGLWGCTNATASNYNPLATCDDGTCIGVVINGCTDPAACNYDPTATLGNPTATSACSGYWGCTANPNACNYDPLAGCDDGSCIPPDGCTDPSASNYDSTALCDDGSCTYPLPNCTDSSGNTHTVGDTYGGGVIFYVGAPNCGGAGVHECGASGFTATGDCAILIGAPGGIGNIEWGCYGTSLNLYSPTNEAIGAGYINDIDITTNCADTGWDCAADKIDQDNAALPWGYGDWYLPSINELVKAYDNIGPGNVYNLGAGWNNPWGVNIGWTLWSSTESSVFSGQYQAQTVDMSNGNIVALDKNASTGDYRSIRREGTVGCTDSTATNYDANAAWQDGNPCQYPTLAIGDSHEGGIIFYFNNGVNATGGGLVISLAEITTPSGAQWGCMGTNQNTGTAIGDGSQNTANIVAGCTNPFIAAKLCNDSTLNGYSDWFLPSKDELWEAYNAVGHSGATAGNVIGMTTNKTYWSSSDAWTLNIGHAWYLNNIASVPYMEHFCGKNCYQHVYAIRAF